MSRPNDAYDTLKGMFLILGIFLALSFAVFLFCQDTPLDLSFQNSGYTFAPADDEAMTDGDFLLSNTYTDAVALGKKVRLTLHWTAVFNDDTRHLADSEANILLSTVEDLNDPAGNFIEYAAFEHKREFWSGPSAEYTITADNVAKDSSSGGYNRRLNAGQVYTFRIEIERNGRKLLVSRFVDDGDREIALPSAWHTFDQLPDELYLRIGGQGCTIHDVHITDAYAMKLGSTLTAVAVLVWLFVLAILLYCIALALQTAHNEEMLSPFFVVITAIPAMVVFVLLSQFLTDRIVSIANEMIRGTLAIELFPSFPLYISFPLRGSVWYVVSLILFGAVLAIFLFLILFSARNPLKTFLIWFVVSIMYVIFLYVYFIFIVGLLNAFLPLGVVLLYFGFMGAANSETEFSSSEKKPTHAASYDYNGETWHYDHTLGDRIILRSYSDESKTISVTKGMNYETDGYLYDDQNRPFRPD